MPTMPPMLEYYARAGRITDPGPFSSCFVSLPTHLPELCTVLHGVMLHPAETRHYGVRLSRSRWRELELCNVSQMLRRMLELEPGPLTAARPPGKRLAGNCRDFATLLCAILRHHGRPARVRYGFATYFAPDFYTDHVVCECWDTQIGHWVLVDAQIDDIHRAVYQITADTCDLTPDQFVTAGRAWRRYRAGEVTADQFGLAPTLGRGVAFIRTGLLRDVAALNKVELPCQVEWDLAGADEETALSLLDRLAALSETPDTSFSTLQALWRGEALLSLPPGLRQYCREYERPSVSA